MNDKELADAVVALGIFQGNHFYWIDKDLARPLTEIEFVRDWRVAGALMEKMVYEELLDMLGNRPAITLDDPVEPREIIEDCVKALTTENSGEAS